MHVLRNMVEAVRPAGELLDLQVIRPNPRVEAGGRLVCEVEGEPLFRSADAATAGRLRSLPSKSSTTSAPLG